MIVSGRTTSSLCRHMDGFIWRAGVDLHNISVAYKTHHNACLEEREEEHGKLCHLRIQIHTQYTWMEGNPQFNGPAPQFDPQWIIRCFLNRMSPPEQLNVQSNWFTFWMRNYKRRLKRGREFITFYYFICVTQKNQCTRNNFRLMIISNGCVRYLDLAPPI